MQVTESLDYQTLHDGKLIYESLLKLMMYAR